MKPLSTAGSAGAPGRAGHGIFPAGDGWRDPQRTQGLAEGAGPQCFPGGDMDGGTSEGRSGVRCFPSGAWMEGRPKCPGTPKGHREPQKARGPPSPKALLGPLPPPSPQRSPAGSPSPPLLRPDRHFSNSAVPGPPPAPSRGGGPGELPAGGPGEREPPFPARPRGSRRSGPRLRRRRRLRPPRRETRGRGPVRRREGAGTPRTRRYRTSPAGEGEAERGWRGQCPRWHGAAGPCRREGAAGTVADPRSVPLEARSRKPRGGPSRALCAGATGWFPVSVLHRGS